MRRLPEVFVTADNPNNPEPNSATPVHAATELWGGVECTCNRVGDYYIDQLELSGHLARTRDLHLFAKLGICRLRIGLIWERGHLDPEWKCTDEYLNAMRDVGISPIAGLVHHGSGPRHTSLVDPRFPAELAAYAGKVAERYPWIDAYTPINEPHTTARFSGLYGVWYPHHQSRRSYLQALFNETRATVLAMREIRRVNSEAKLIQTDDVGSIHGTQELQGLVKTLQDRRWIGFDLLCGRIDRSHPLYSYIRHEGFTDNEILWFRDNPCPPDVIGINYYLTSDRFLDHRTELYPTRYASAEGPIVDVEAVRVPSGTAGFGALLEEAWSRYRIPVALTEVHLGGPVDDQIRWLVEAWQGAAEARRKGASCIAITLWALLGSFYWNELVTRPNGHYEPGAFDVSAGEPKATALAEVIAQLRRGEEPSHPALQTEGWWRRADRILWSENIQGLVNERAA